MSSEQSTISVILPTWNRLDRLQHCLPSILATKAKGVEFIIVDNCSDDGTWEYLQQLSLDDNRIRIFRNPQNIGPVKTILRAYCEVRSPYAVFVSDDDIMRGDYIKLCLQIFEKHKDVGMVHHIFEAWKNQDPPEEYGIFDHGNEAIRSVFMKCGTYTGIAWRMGCFDIKDYQIGTGQIYPQVHTSLNIVSKNDLAIINKCGFVNANWEDTVLSNISTQNRPSDYGLNERMKYAEQVCGVLLLQQLGVDISSWAFNIYLKLREESPVKAREYIVSLSSSIHKVTPLIIWKLFRSGHLKDFSITVLHLFGNPSFILNYFYFLIFVVMKLRNKK